MKDWLRIYTEQKRRAGTRNIDWNFTYESWLAWWSDDLEKRGRKKGQLVMARYGDVGPYSPENVRKATAEENIIESHLGRKRPAETGLKISKANKGKVQTEEHKQKNREKQLGKKQSAETIAKRIATWKSRRPQPL
jgi:hypothetical protein